MNTQTWHDILRPFFGFVVLQPLLLIWMYLFTDDWVKSYHEVGWTLNIVCTIYLIPMYIWYEKNILVPKQP